MNDKKYIGNFDLEIEYYTMEKFPIPNEKIKIIIQEENILYKEYSIEKIIKDIFINQQNNFIGINFQKNL